MPKTLTYNQTFTINAPATEIFNFLGDPENHQQLHPLIKQLTVVERGEESGNAFVVFDILDEIRMLGFPMKVKYRTKMTLYKEEKRLYLDALAPPSVKTQVTWRMIEKNDVTHIEERVSLTAPTLLADFSTKQSRDAHISMFAKLKKLLES